MPAFSSWGNQAVDRSGLTWDESLAPAWEHQDSPFGKCGLVENQIAGCTLEVSGLTSLRGPGGTVLVPMIGSEIGRHRLIKTQFKRKRKAA